MTPRVSTEFSNANLNDAPAEGPTVTLVPPLDSPPASAPASSDATPEQAAVKEAAQVMARAKHRAETDLGGPVRMLDLHDLERSLDERVTRLEEWTGTAPAPTPATAPPAHTEPSPARRGGSGLLLLLVVVFLGLAVWAGTRKGTP